MARPRILLASLVLSLLASGLRPESASAAGGAPPDGLGVMTAGSILIFPLFDNSVGSPGTELEFAL